MATSTTTPAPTTPSAAGMSANAGDTSKFDAAYDGNVTVNAGEEGEGEGTEESTAAGTDTGGDGAGTGTASAGEGEGTGDSGDSTDPILAALATEMEVDLSNASESDLAMLKKMAGQDWVKEKYGTSEATVGDATLTDEEYRKLLGEDEGETDTTATQPPEKKDDKPITPPPTDGGYTFKNAKEWLAQVQEASEKNDIDRYIDLQSQFVEINVRGMQPYFEQIVKDQVQQMLGSALPVIKRTAEADHRATSREHALKVLEGNPGFKDIRELFKPDGEQPITYNGRQVESNPLNRILKANPELLDIAVIGKDGKVNHAATQAKILMAVHRKWKSPATKAATQQAMKAGIKIGEKIKTQANGASMSGKGKAAVASQSQGGDDYASELRDIAAKTRVNL